MHDGIIFIVLIKRKTLANQLTLFEQLEVILMFVFSA